MREARSHSPRSALLPYALPYLLYVGLGALVDPRERPLLAYTLRALLVGSALVALRAHYLPLRGPRAPLGSIALGIAAGLLGLGLWLALVAPFAPAPAPAWSGSDWLARALVASVLPPLVEELFMRGWLLRFVLLWQSAGSLAGALDERRLDELAPGAWSSAALLATSAVFALGHAPHEWLAAFAYGALMVALWIARGDLVSCVSAHATTNAALALYVRTAGEWRFW